MTGSANPARTAGPASGLKVLITAGPTAEDIDPVRFITNRSSGRMGVELAIVAHKAGAEPILILGPTRIAPPDNIRTIRIRSAEDMAKAVDANFPNCEALIMAAAVADYTPAEPLDHKLKKADGDLILRLKRTRDILAGIAKSPHREGRYVIGFSLDVDMNLVEGRRKLEAKNLDLIVVNSVSSFDAGRETATLLSRETPDRPEPLGDIPKDQLAQILIDRIIRRRNSTIVQPR